MRITRWNGIAQYQSFNRDIENSPYQPVLYLSRAKWYEAHNFPDLAAGDAYKALLLSDEIRDEFGEYHQEARAAVRSISISSQQDGISDFLKITTYCENEQYGPRGLAQGPNSKFMNEHAEKIANQIAFDSYSLLASTLSSCGCLQSAYDFARRGLQIYPNARSLEELQSDIGEKGKQIRSDLELKNLEHITEHSASITIGTGFNFANKLPEQGTARRILYPWNEYEPDRLSDITLHDINDRLVDVAPKCEVRVISLPLLLPGETCEKTSSGEVTDNHSMIKQLGLFASEDIASNEVILCERSILTANNRLHDTLCDACSGPLPVMSESVLTCDDCEDTVFCSPACASLAQELYHPAVCGRSDFDLVAKDPSPDETSSALYLALLARAFALAATQGIHPLILPEVQYLWGDFTAVPSSPSSHIERRLPFSFQRNVVDPLSILEKMDVNIFTSPLAETWVTNTLYAKFRGTASARFSTDGVARGPEVAAVHPMWCLANHSCAPNVKWDWSAEIRFKARGGEDLVRWGPDAEQDHEEGNCSNNREDDSIRTWQGGIKKGDEILNHYCDVALPVQERSEWASGALGGNCMCKRCLWEGHRALLEPRAGE